MDRNQQHIDDRVAATRALAKAKAIAVDAKKTVNHGHVEVDALRATCKDTKHLTAKIMSNPITFRIVQVTVCVCQAVRDQHAVHTEMMHTKRGSFEFSTSMARGSYEKVLSDTCGFFSSRACLLQCGFEVPPPQGKATAQYFDWDAFPHKDDNDMAKLMLTPTLHIICFRGITSMTYKRGLAEVFFGLVDPTPGIKAATLKYLQSVWEGLEWTESIMHMASAVVNRLNKLIWPRSDWIRSVLIVLSELGFNFVSTWLNELLRGLAGGVVTTEICERVFNTFRDSEWETKSSLIEAGTRWTRAVGSRIVQDFDRGVPPVTNAVRTALADIGKVQVHKNTFKHNSSPFSFGEEKLKEMTGKQTWPSATPAAFANTAIGTTCLVNAFRDASKLRNAYMSLLAVVGWILRPQLACVEVGFYTCMSGDRTWRARSQIACSCAGCVQVVYLRQRAC